MPELTKIQKKTLENVKKTINLKEIAIPSFFAEIKLEIEDLKEKIEQELARLSESLKKKSEEELSYALTDEDRKELKGDHGNDGENYILTMEDKHAIAELIKVPVVEKVIEKRIEIIKQEPIVTQEIKEVAKYETAIETADKLNQEEEVIDQSVIKGLDKSFKKIDDRINKIPIVRGGGNPRKSRMRAYSLTSQCDGNTKVFTLPPKTINVAGVFGTEFPVNFDPTDDWIFNGSTLTLGNGVNPPATGQTLWVLLETLFLV